jgi:CRP/FNR family transcriptional regulator
LAEIPCLQKIPKSIMKDLMSHAGEKGYPKGTLLVRQGRANDLMFIVTEGRLKLYRSTDSGRRQTIRFLGPGECHCFAPLYHEIPSPVTVECHTDVRLVVIHRAHLTRLAANDISIPAAVIQCLSGQLAEAIHHAGMVSHQFVRERLAATLLDLARRQGTDTDGGTLIEGLTHEELAACVGTVREVVSRALTRFQREGTVVRAGRGKLLIRDSSRLHGILSTFPPNTVM